MTDIWKFRKYDNCMGVCQNCQEFARDCCFSSSITFVPLDLFFFHFRDLLHEYPDLSSLKCLVSAVSVPNRRPWSDIPESTDGPDTLRQSTEAELVHGSCRGWAIIMPFEESAWTPTQLAPFIQRISSGQTIDGTVGLFTPLTSLVPCNWSSEVIKRKLILSRCGR